MEENEAQITKLCDLYAKSQNVDYLQKCFYEKGLRKGLELTGTTINESQLDNLFYNELKGYSDKYPNTNSEFFGVKEAYINGFNDRKLINGKASYHTRLSYYLRNYYIKKANEF